MHMPFIKSAKPFGKKQAPMPGPNSAAYKKIIAARKSAASGKPAAARSRQKATKSALFSTLKSRQLVIERVKREIWASVHAINHAIISLALAGNYNAAKALFDFAGVYNLPSPEEAATPAAVPAPSVGSPATQNVPPNPVDAFFKSIGIEPVGDEPEPDMAA
jgi:hypothetical protein